MVKDVENAHARSLYQRDDLICTVENFYSYEHRGDFSLGFHGDNFVKGNCTYSHCRGPTLDSRRNLLIPTKKML
jgi:hypothetical protein